MKKLLMTLCVLFSAFCAGAQDTAQTASEQMTGLRASGKIYVVLVVAITILSGLIIYVITLDRKLSKLEKGQ